tara:strand:- start:33079 stop:34119 length:1041 start_codon:yes stop_codon:yes gene_type:complete
MPINDRIQEKLGIDVAIFGFLDETQIQEQLEGVLREKALDHLLSSSAPMAESFRSNFQADHDISIEHYVSKMSQHGAWATTDEAVALAEMLDINLDVKMIGYAFNQEGTDVIEVVKKGALYRTHTPDAPTITLNNRENEHWFINDKTKSLGDCLFDAMAQALQQLVRPELTREHTNGSPLSDVTDTESIERIEYVDNKQLQLLKTKIGSEAISHLIDTMQKTPLSEFNAAQQLSEALIRAIGTEMPNIDDDFKFMLQTAESINDLNIILDDMRMSLKERCPIMVDTLKEGGVIRNDECKMLNQRILHATDLGTADKLLSELIQRLSGATPQSDTPRDDDVTPSRKV